MSYSTLETNRSLPELHTERLTLRLPEKVDAATLLQFHQANEQRFLPTDPPKPAGFLTEDYWAQRVDHAHAEHLAGTALRLLILDRKNSALVGTVNFTQIFRGPFQACTLGYKIGEKYEGKGLMSEALSSAIAYVFNELNLHRIMANYLPTNERSARLLAKLGFVIEGHAPNYLYIDGRWRDHVLTALSNPTWHNSF